MDAGSGGSGPLKELFAVDYASMGISEDDSFMGYLLIETAGSSNNCGRDVEWALMNVRDKLIARYKKNFPIEVMRLKFRALRRRYDMFNAVLTTHEVIFDPQINYVYVPVVERSALEAAYPGVSNFFNEGPENWEDLKLLFGSNDDFNVPPVKKLFAGTKAGYGSNATKIGQGSKTRKTGSGFNANDPVEISDSSTDKYARNTMKIRKGTRTEEMKVQYTPAHEILSDRESRFTGPVFTPEGTFTMPTLSEQSTGASTPKLPFWEP
ncbi:hypothetical protein ACP275_09G021500 [Erythranthe tilingii]